MHLRRALLLMGAVLLVVAAVQALVPVSRVRDGAGRRSAPASPPRSPPVRSLAFRYPPPEHAPKRTLRTGTHLTLRVSSSASGEVTIRALGLIQTVEPRTPAVFDILASRAGSYDVEFDPVVGRPVRVGRVLVSGSGRRP